MLVFNVSDQTPRWSGVLFGFESAPQQLLPAAPVTGLVPVIESLTVAALTGSDLSYFVLTDDPSFGIDTILYPFLMGNDFNTEGGQGFNSRNYIFTPPLPFHAGRGIWLVTSPFFGSDVAVVASASGYYLRPSTPGMGGPPPPC